MNAQEMKMEELRIEKEKYDTKRSVTQILDTMSFEFKRNLKKALIMILLFLGIFALFYLIEDLQVGQGLDLPATAEEYISSYVGGLFTFLLNIAGATFAGSIIAEDFEKQTGNLIFPKIKRNRLLLGRVVSRYLLNIIPILIYYVVLGVVVFVNYGGIPAIMWTSMLWAMLYTLMIFGFVTFMSSINKKTSTSIIISILILMIVFNMVESILMFTGSTVEPLFSLTYFANIISLCLDMPSERFSEMVMGGPGGVGGGTGATFTSWSTPSVQGALVGMLLYTLIFAVLAYIFYRRRQMKN